MPLRTQKRLLLLPAILAGLLWPAAVLAQAQGYRLDPVHTRIAFAVDHAGFSAALGTVTGSTGAIAFDPDDWRGTRVDQALMVASIIVASTPQFVMGILLL